MRLKSIKRSDEKFVSRIPACRQGRDPESEANRDLRNKLFFKKLLVFIILVIVVNMLLNAVYDHWMYYFRLARIQDEQFDAHSDTLKYLMLGNSHNRINPEILGNGFCYIMPKEIYTQTYYKLKYILEKTNKRPENILLSIDPVNFSPRAENELSFDGNL